MKRGGFPLLNQLNMRTRPPKTVQNEAVSVRGVDHRTFKRRLQEPVFYQAWEEGQAAGAVALRQLQWKHAKRPDASGVAMTIHMSKHLLGQSDKALHLNLTVQDVDELIARLEHERAQQLVASPGEHCEVRTIEVQAPTRRPAEC
jgi:hypothetical protein